MKSVSTQTFHVDKIRILQRQAVLEEAKARLKEDFVGIDAVIDNLMDYIRIWYLMPEVLTRPLIVCLWGMTGVGKTDLVRKLVKYLDYQDRFTELELGNSDETNYFSSVSYFLNQEGFDDGQPAIVLFDEIQRFHTIERGGEPVGKTQFTDFWQLLSDGRLPKRDKDEISEYITRHLHSQRKRQQKNEESDEEKTDYYENEIGLWEARSLKKLLGLEQDVLELAELNHYQAMELAFQAADNKTVYEPVDYSKLLILISGNLDEAFRMATQTSESDIDADIFHAFTRKITQVDIKNALTKRFRPEQVARFGNIHLIYTSLRRADFERLIVLEVSKIIDRTYARFGVRLEVGDAVYNLIYRNGVFPVQGVRPVFSSIIDILETNLSKFLFEGLLEDVDWIAVDYDVRNAEIVARIGSLREVRLPYMGRIDRIRDEAKPDQVLNISAHEAGHAVAYIVLFGLAPLQLKSRVAGSYAEGFTFPHEIYLTRDSIVKEVMVYLAGGLAEELLFGAGNATIGRSNDREEATRLVMEYVRQYGFNAQFQADYLLDEGSYALDRKVTDPAIEQMLAGLVDQTRQLLAERQDFLLALTNSLAATGSLDAAAVADLAALHGLRAQVKPEGYRHMPEFGALLADGSTNREAAETL